MFRVNAIFVHHVALPGLSLAPSTAVLHPLHCGNFQGQLETSIIQQNESCILFFAKIYNMQTFSNIANMSAGSWTQTQQIHN